MKRNFKITIAALSAMLVMALAVSVISFSFAGNKGRVATLTDADEPEVPVTKSIIDYIIENSYAVAVDEDEVVDPIYHIVEVGSSATPSGLKAFCENGGFGTYVIDGNKSESNTKVLNPDIDAIEYTYIQASKVKNKVDKENLSADEQYTNDSLAKVAGADFIYVSNDHDNMYSVTNDLSEDMYNALHKFSDTKPLIIDSPTETAGIDPKDNKYSMKKLVQKVFGVSGMYYYTFAWDSKITSAEFLQHKKGSLYLGIRGSRTVENWATYPREGDGGAEYTVAKFLAVSADGNTKTMAESLLNCPKDTTSISGLEVYDISDVNNNYENPSVMYEDGYNSRYSIPDFIKLETAKLDKIDKIDLSQYDMVIFEKSCNTATITVDEYKHLAAAMYANISMVYDSGMGTGEVINPDKPSDAQETNYKELFYLVATAKEKPRYANIMVTSREKLAIIMDSNSAETCKVIADIINKSQFRMIGGKSSASDIFTVLEVQPCYPIDLELAERLGKKVPRKQEGNNGGTSDKNKVEEVFGKGNYYLDPAYIENGKTKEEIEGDTEYYAWELSPAKIVDAIPTLSSVDEVNIVHMSTEELACSKTDLLGTYDMIYIGGNYTALKEASQFQSLVGLNNWGGSLGMPDVRVSLEKSKELPVYTMYAHGGDFAAVHSLKGSAGMGGMKLVGGDPAGMVKIGNEQKNTFAVLNGNDITYDMKEKFMDYIEAGMPVIVSDDLAAGYLAKAKDGYLQNSIDPDSNMCKVLDKLFSIFNPTGILPGSDATSKAAYAALPKVRKNVLWGFDRNGVVHVDNDGGKLGATNTGYVVVYADDIGSYDIEDADKANLRKGDKDKIVALFNSDDTKTRAKLTLTSAPPIYNMYDDTTKISNGILGFKFEIEGCNDYEVRLYIDDNGNSVFEESESIDATPESGTDQGPEYNIPAASPRTEMKYAIPEDFFGPLYWKVEVYDTRNEMVTASSTGFSYVAKEVTEKQTVKVLQVLPRCKGYEDGPQSVESLRFCTVCQQAYRTLKHNPYNYQPDGAAAAESYGAMYRIGYIENERGTLDSSDYYLGKHEHIFGIVKYDSGLTLKDNNDTIYGRDDWYANLADESAVKNRFDFDLDIIYRDEFEQWSKDVHKIYDDLSEEDTLKEIAKRTLPKDLTDVDADVYLPESYEDDDRNVANLISWLGFADQDAYEAWYSSSTTNVDRMKGLYDEAKETADLREEVLRLYIQQMIDNVPAAYAKGNKFGNASQDELIREFNRLLSKRQYADYFSISGRQVQWSGNINTYYINADVEYENVTYTYRNFYDVYKWFVDANDKELDAEVAYKKAVREANPTDWIYSCYTTIVLGPADDFGGDDITVTSALDDLETYLNGDGQLLLFHDTLSWSATQGSHNLTSRLRAYFGQDRYHMVQDKAKANTNTKYVPYVLDKIPYSGVPSETDEEKYFMMNLSTYNDDSKYENWSSEMYKVFQTGDNGFYLSATAYSDGIHAAAKDYGPLATPYRYSDFNWADSTYWYNDAGDSAKKNSHFGTNKATQNNKGIVTTFPFTLSDKLYVSGTHSQAYALDIEDSNLTVWYSLAGGTGASAAMNSSTYAASPNDGMDSYFVYSYHNVYYCGAGHSKITGIGKDNNDERMLYINILCNSVKKSINTTKSLKCYDYKTPEDPDGLVGTNDKKVLIDGDNYKIKVEDMTDTPEFSSVVRLNDELSISEVKIFYDLDYETYSGSGNINQYLQGDNHILIANWNSTQAKKNKRLDCGADNATLEYDGNGKLMLTLKPEYFAPYGNEYTWIVVQVKCSDNSYLYKRIKVVPKQYLFNLT